MNAKLIAIALLTGSMVTPALASSTGSSYLGAQFSRATYDASDIGDVSPSALVGRFGHFIHESFAIEGRLGLGLSDDSLTAGEGANVAFEIDNLIGIYGTAHLNLSSAASIYALAGFTRGEATATASYMGQTFSETDDDTSFSWGVGSQFNITQQAGLNIEYASYLDKSDYQVTAFSAGANYRF